MTMMMILLALASSVLGTEIPTGVLNSNRGPRLCWLRRRPLLWCFCFCSRIVVVVIVDAIVIIKLRYVALCHRRRRWWCLLMMLEDDDDDDIVSVGVGWCNGSDIVLLYSLSFVGNLLWDHSLFPSVYFCSRFVAIIVQLLLSGCVWFVVVVLLLALTMIVSACGRGVHCVCCRCYYWRRCWSLASDNPREPLTRWCPSRTLSLLQ